MKFQRLFPLLLLVFLAACQPGAASPADFEPLPGSRRAKLTYADLIADAYQGDGPVDNAYLAPPAAAPAAAHTLAGRLSIPEFEMAYRSHDDGLPRRSHLFFPQVSLDFFTYEDHLVPVDRDIVRGSGQYSYWNVIFSPGKIWSEAGDKGYSRAAFPFVLVNDNYNEAHNGLATFLFNERQVSSLYLQITQETAAWHRTDLWGQTPISFEPCALSDREKRAHSFAQELAAMPPIRPWSELIAGRDPEELAAITSDIDPADISVSGIIMDGAVYLHDCNTRTGPFPYCQHMRHGVFSVTKSLGAAVAMLRLAQKYGEEVYELQIADYVDIQANHNGWAGVTFGDALDMATGVGDHLPRPVQPNVIHGDEDQARFSDFLLADSAESKLAIAFDYGDYPWGPGEIARYNSVNTFLLSAAMDAFLKEKEGAQADIWDMVVEEVYQRIGVQHAPIMRTVELDGRQGLPIFGYGLYPTVAELARITTLLQNGGRHQGQQLLHPGKLAEALYQSSEDGLPTGQIGPSGEGRYNASYWGVPYQDSAGEISIVPYMMGYGGNLVVLAPNGIAAFRFADAHNYDVYSMVRAAAAVRPFPAPTD